MLKLTITIHPNDLPRWTALFIEESIPFNVEPIPTQTATPKRLQEIEGEAPIKRRKPRNPKQFIQRRAPGGLRLEDAMLARMASPTTVPDLKALAAEIGYSPLGVTSLLSKLAKNKKVKRVGPGTWVAHSWQGTL